MARDKSKKHSDTFKDLDLLFRSLGKVYFEDTALLFPALCAISDAYFNTHPDDQHQRLVAQLPTQNAVVRDLEIIQRHEGMPRAMKVTAKRLLSLVNEPDFYEWLIGEIRKSNAEILGLSPDFPPVEDAGEPVPEHINPALLQIPNVQSFHYEGGKVELTFGPFGANAVTQEAVRSAFAAANCNVTVRTKGPAAMVVEMPGTERIMGIKLREAARQIAHANRGLPLSTATTPDYPNPR